ncbi:MAG: polysaccharide biosynthesis/export family protein [Paracoccus sp. (in: a-proteobacteria)]|uniref:polysaccharide biosynthesis/export family protein n=1 Tax=Paracoccus sp. TaxID=267 RepID=UPI0026DFE321|nr:polysaccharide biosynthesis/export family protein [Paracoccus sp. (in: a-proteobacteria)]MDO5630281.1 polysaccharide biosynthesis/export family protein [Paracoccus sp. (in: a-proteobacteria)]
MMRLAALAALTLVAACALPRSGPNKNEIFGGSVERGGNTHVIYVNDHVTRAANFAPSYGFSRSFQTAGAVGADEIRAGDVLGLGIWENVDDGLLAGLGQSATQLQQIQVDSQGYIFVPYAGRVRAAGSTPEQLRQSITSRLSAQTPDPQVTVTRMAGDGATVSVMGKVMSQGVYPIERPTRTLSAMLARAGGVAIEPEIAVVTVKRGSDSGRVWLRDLYGSSSNDIALRPGDIILVEEDQRSFTALGALGGQTKVPLGNEQINAVEAIAMVGGLNSNLADPTGVFVLRDEPESVASRVLGKPVFGSQRIAYVLDLTRPNGLFLARDFIIRDSDTIYVTEAPYVQWNKTLSAITGSATTADRLSSIGN